MNDATHHIDEGVSMSARSVSPTGAKSLKVINPATLQLTGEIRCHAPEDVGSALDAARTAQVAWASLPLSARLDVLRKVQQSIMAGTDEIARTICHETGKPRVDALSNDIMAALSLGDYAIGAVPQMLRTKKVDLGRVHFAFTAMGRSSYIQPRPVGVVAVISPWNYPFGIPYSQTVMAVAAGNAVLIKPSSLTPFSGVHIARLFEGAGAPSGLVQTLIGSGGDVGSALVRSGVDRIIFTGSGKVGRDIMRDAIQRLTPVTLELGGKDPLVVLADADLKRAARAAIWGSFVNAGQTCAAVKRILVHERVLADFTERLLVQVQKIKVGWGWEDPTISMGPLINESAVEEVDGMVQRAIASGGKVLFGGKRPAGLNRNYYLPTILTDVDRRSEVGQSEIFGPLVVILPFKDEEDAITAAKECPYALAGSVWTRDLKKGRDVAARMPGGSVIVNNVAYSYGLGATPWGGSGESGFGRTHGDLGFAELLEHQHIHIDKGGFDPRRMVVPLRPGYSRKGK